MQQYKQPTETTPAVVRLGPGSSLLILGVRGALTIMRGAFNLWVALTPDRDHQDKRVRSRA